MKKQNGILLALSALFIAILSASPALAHRFNVVLIVPLSGAEVELGELYRNGFLLATTEKDAHPDETSDGHLGGLDSYVSYIDAAGDVNGQVQNIIGEGETNIVVGAFATISTLSQIAPLLEQANIALLSPGVSPFAQSNLPQVERFTTLFEQQYNRQPSEQAAQGYNAAWRIDAAVRAQGSTDSATKISASFDQSAKNFNW